MTRRLYSKEQVADMMILSDDESDIDNINHQTIFDFGSDNDNSETDFEPHEPLVHTQLLDLTEVSPPQSYHTSRASPSQSRITSPTPVSPPHSYRTPRTRVSSPQSRITSPSPVSPPQSEVLQVQPPQSPFFLRDQQEWKLLDSDSDFIPPHFLFLGIPGLVSENEEKILSTIDDGEMIKISMNLFLTEELFNDLVEFTNIRANQYLEEEGDNLKPHSRFRKWSDTNVHEMKRFIGMILLMSVIHKPSLNEYSLNEHFWLTAMLRNYVYLN